MLGGAGRGGGLVEPAMRVDRARTHRPPFLCSQRLLRSGYSLIFCFFQAEDGIRASSVTGVQTCALPICASARIFRPDLDLRAGYGQRGLLTGGPYPGFEKNQGTLGWLGATVRLDGPWFAAFQLDQANDVPAYYSPRHYPGDDTQYDPGSALGLGSKRVTSWAASLGYGRGVLRDGDFRLRTTLLGSRTSAPLFSPAARTAGTEGSSAPGLV